MSSTVELEAANIIAPVLNGAGRRALNRIAAIATSTSSARTDLSTLISDVGDGHYLTLMADGGDIYIAFNNADAGSIDETATGAGATVPWKLEDSVPQHFRIVENFYWAIHKAASGAPKLRVYLSSCGSQQEVL